MIELQTGPSNFIYAPNGKNGLDRSHCHKPTPLLINNDILRIYFGARDSSGITRTSFVDVSSEDPKKILSVATIPCFDIGVTGAFGLKLCINITPG